MDLSEADLNGADLGEATLVKASLAEANLRGANLSNAKLNEANLSNAIVGWTYFDDVDLSRVKGFATLRHYSPSSIALDTIYKSRGLIPEIFLRHAGVPESFLEVMSSLINQPLEFYSCFMSYSNRDQAFVYLTRFRRATKSRKRVLGEGRGDALSAHVGDP